ncbi:MAG TPA: hypothetical protein VEA40_21680 [Ramlibacter sp.]|nr:hypothetical protein [Ramlibacter sp.]
MTTLPDTLWRRLRAALLTLAFAGLLASCGPGTGGTGVGPISFSTTLPLTGAASIAAASTPGCGGCTRADLRLEEGRVELLVPCGRFVSGSDWNPQAQMLLLSGSFESTAGGAPVAAQATLRLQFSREASDSEQVTVTVMSLGGANLVQPLVLQRQAASNEGGSCTR